jgi:hypothetical protein
LGEAVSEAGIIIGCDLCATCAPIKADTYFSLFTRYPPVDERKAQSGASLLTTLSTRRCKIAQLRVCKSSPFEYDLDVPVLQSKAKKPATIKSETELLSEATRRLLRGIKENAKKKGKSLSREELLRRGYDKKFIAKLEAA